MSPIAPHKTRANLRDNIRQMLLIALEEAKEIYSSPAEGLQPNSKTIKAANDLIEHIHELNIGAPSDLYAASNGEIVFSWRKDNYVLDVWLMPDGTIKNFFGVADALNNTEGKQELDKALMRFAA
jgi:hypothetical protein